MPFDEVLIEAIVRKACLEGTELPWIEFKTNNSNPQAIGEYISALSNTAALFNQAHGFMIWGIDDKTHQITGTSFDPASEKIGNEGISLWLATQLDPQIQFYFHSVTIERKTVILMEISAAYSTPVRFRGIDYIRIDSYKKSLKDFPDSERELWAILSRKPFERVNAMENTSGEFVLRLLDYPSYFELLSIDMPSEKNKILDYLAQDKLITRNEAGLFDITNMGALLIARKLSDFPSLERKAMRIIRYNGTSRTSPASKEIVIDKGFASGFEGIVSFIIGLIPDNEQIGTALRKNKPLYPELAIRELVANAIIHQNFYLRGTSVMVEIFNNRFEISNPGIPLIEKERFVDYPPVSRNEVLTSFMRRIGVCEERGSGFDKIVEQTEQFQLPAPEIETLSNHTRVVLYAHQEFSEMSKEDKLRACYLHACLKRVNRQSMTNTSLRERFSISKDNSSMVSRLLSEACRKGIIKISDTSASVKTRSYLPYWA
jgi:ATP-dependent DNA helicase RecG